MIEHDIHINGVKNKFFKKNCMPITPFNAGFKSILKWFVKNCFLYYSVSKVIFILCLVEVHLQLLFLVNLTTNRQALNLIKKLARYLKEISISLAQLLALTFLACNNSKFVKLAVITFYNATCLSTLFVCTRLYGHKDFVIGSLKPHFLKNIHCFFSVISLRRDTKPYFHKFCVQS